jgi:hypothetical protein
MTDFIVTEFKSVNAPSPVSKRGLEEILFDIKSDKYKQKVDTCRTAADKVALEFAKRQLSLFTPTGVFTYRSIAGMQKYNGIICLDIDHIENPTELKNICKTIDWVYSAFITPSGKGLKVLVKTNATPETYKETELKVSGKFFELTGAERDNHCKDIARIQYISHDPDIYLNTNSLIFE